jgi:hypothetical protein
VRTIVPAAVTGVCVRGLSLRVKLPAGGHPAAPPAKS